MIVLDIETAPQARALAIPEDADERKGRRSDWSKICATSPRLGYVVAVGLYPGGVRVALPEQEEPALIAYAFEHIVDIAMSTARDDVLVTFNGRTFDLPFLAVRAAVHGVELPPGFHALSRRYVRERHCDLADVLSNHGPPEKGNNLHNWCAAFGIPVEDSTSGVDVAGMVAKGDRDGIAAHCASDVRLALALYEKCKAVGLAW